MKTDLCLNIEGVNPVGVYSGNYGVMDGRPGPFGGFQGYEFKGQTGGYNSTVSIPGVTASAADVISTPGTYALMNFRHAAGNGPATNGSLRPYVDFMTVSVMGNTAWTGGAGVSITDSNSNLGIWIPVTALQANAVLRFGFDSETRLSMFLTAASYNATTGAITFPATSFVTTSYVSNAPFRIVSGTGAGQAGLIASNTATVITPVGGSAAFPVAPDATSVFAFPYWVSTGEGATTVAVASQGGSATPLAAGGLAQGFWAIDVISGAERLILSNSNTTATINNAWTNNPSTGDLIEFTTNPSLNGAIDFATGGLPCFGLGTGLQAIVAASMSAGSPLRIQFGGHFGR